MMSGDSWVMQAMLASYTSDSLAVIQREDSTFIYQQG
jgi:hypothetical protein